MKKLFVLALCFLMIAWNFSPFVNASQKDFPPLLGKRAKNTKEANLVSNPEFTMFEQKEKNSWVYAINGGKNTNFNHVPLTPSQGGGYDIPDGAGNPTVGHVDQADFNGEKGVSIINKATPQNKYYETRLGQSMTGLEVGKRYVFSIDIQSNVATKYTTSLQTKKNTGLVSGARSSTSYPSDSYWTDLAAGKWKTLFYTFVAKDTSLWFNLSFQQSSKDMRMNVKRPRLVASLQLPEGFTEGAASDTISWKEGNNTLAMGWGNRKEPTLSYNGRDYSYRDRLDAAAIVNNRVTSIMGDYAGIKGIFSANQTITKLYGKNEKALYQSFIFTDINQNLFKFEFIQEKQPDNSATNRYTLQNLTAKSLQLGFLVHGDLEVESDKVPVTPVNNFKGFSMQATLNGPRLTIFPQDFESWSAASIGGIPNFAAFTPHSVMGKGWETGFLYGDPSRPLEENKAVDLGDSGFLMKNLGKEVAPLETISFTSQLKYGTNSAPDLSLNQSHFSVGEGEAVTIKGQAWDPDTSSFKVALVDKTTGTVLSGQSFEGVNSNEKKDFALALPANQLKLGKNEFIARVADKWGAKKELPVTVTVSGVLKFAQVPATLSFENTEITSQSKIIKRQDANWQIKINNSIGKNWQVKAKSTPVQDKNGKIHPNALVFKSENGSINNLGTGYQLIATGDKTKLSPVISWTADKGILFRYSPGTMKTGSYKSTVTFTLEDVPSLK